MGLASVAIHTDGTWGASKYIMESTNLVGALKGLHLGGVRGLPQHECRGQRITCRNFLFFHHVGSRDQVQVIRLVFKYLYLRSHLVYPDFGKFAVG